MATLGRPRIDVLLDVSSIFRDTFQMSLDLLDDLFRRAARADEPAELNYLRANADALIAQGRSVEEATARIFTQAPGLYGTGVDEVIEESQWDDTNQLADLYQRRNGYTAGGGRNGAAAPQVLKGLLGTVDHVFQAIDSVEYGLTDMTHYYGHSGAMQLAASRARGSEVSLSYAETFTGDVKLKRTLQLRWRDWEACARIARGPVYEPMFEHLMANPEDFRGAIEHVPLRQRVIHAFAYQSLLWNRAVSRLLRGGVDSSQRLRIATIAGDLLAWKYLAPEREEKLKTMRTPLYGPDGDGGSEAFRRVMQEELREAGLVRDDFVRNEVPGMIWKEEAREVWVKPTDVDDVRIEPDERYDGKVTATRQFSLPRGAYATMMIKRLFAPSWFAPEDRQDDGGDGGRGRFDRGGDDRGRDERSRDEDEA
jgi:hypothetical protein